jgi:hypothetical protein
MKEVMYDQSSVLIATVLFVSMTIVIEMGFRIGRASHSLTDDSSKEHVTTIQASLLGVLALLLGFTFSLSLQRYDSRSQAVVDEANAIGTAYLRAQLLPEVVRDDVLANMRTYLDQRMRAGAVNLADDAERLPLLAAANDTLAQLWVLAREAAAAEPSPVTTGLYIQSLNDMIDAFGRRDAALNRHVPEVVLFLVYGTFLMTGVIVGYASGLRGHRASFVTHIMVGLIVLLVFIIIDLDRPRRGLIQVSQESMAELRSSMSEPIPPLDQAATKP